MYTCPVFYVMTNEFVLTLYIVNKISTTTTTLTKQKATSSSIKSNIQKLKSGDENIPGKCLNCENSYPNFVYVSTQFTRQKDGIQKETAPGHASHVRRIGLKSLDTPSRTHYNYAFNNYSRKPMVIRRNTLHTPQVLTPVPLKLFGKNYETKMAKSS